MIESLRCEVSAEVLDGRLLRDAYGQFPTGVVAVCATVDGENVGMAVSAFMPVSLVPPLISVCIQSSSTTWPVLSRAGAIGVSVLSRTQHGVAGQLAARGADRFAGLDLVATPEGAIFIADAQLWFDTRIDASHTAGDHEIVLLRVNSLTTHPGADDPMVFHGSKFRSLRHLRGAGPPDIDFSFW